MMKLTNEQIEQLASRTGAKRIAVENFLMSLYGVTKDEALGNLSLDARSYKWNAQTVKAIRNGIYINFAEE